MVSCSRKKANIQKLNMQKSNIQVAVNSNYRQYLWYPSIYPQAKDSTFFDSIKNVTITQFDSLSNGEIEVSVFSMLTDNFEERVELEKDTIITFDAAIYSRFNKVNTAEEFFQLSPNLSDTIYLGQKIVGCFGGEIEKIKISKQRDNNFRIEYSNAGNQKFIFFDRLFQKHFQDFIAQARAFFPKTENGFTITNLSTTRFDRYIRNGNNILKLPDFSDWKGYDDFKIRIGIIIE